MFEEDTSHGLGPAPDVDINRNVVQSSTAKLSKRASYLQNFTLASIEKAHSESYVDSAKGGANFALSMPDCPSYKSGDVCQNSSSSSNSETQRQLTRLSLGSDSEESSRRFPSRRSALLALCSPASNRELSSQQFSPKDSSARNCGEGCSGNLEASCQEKILYHHASVETELFSRGRGRRLMSLLSPSSDTLISGKESPMQQNRVGQSYGEEIARQTHFKGKGRGVMSCLSSVSDTPSSDRDCLDSDYSEMSVSLRPSDPVSGSPEKGQYTRSTPRHIEMGSSSRSFVCKGRGRGLMVHLPPASDTFSSDSEDSTQKHRTLHLSPASIDSRQSMKPITSSCEELSGQPFSNNWSGRRFAVPLPTSDSPLSDQESPRRTLTSERFSSSLDSDDIAMIYSQIPYSDNESKRILTPVHLNVDDNLNKMCHNQSFQGANVHRTIAKDFHNTSMSAVPMTESRRSIIKDFFARVTSPRKQIETNLSKSMPNLFSELPEETETLELAQNKGKRFFPMSSLLAGQRVTNAPKIDYNFGKRAELGRELKIPDQKDKQKIPDQKNKPELISVNTPVNMCIDTVGVQPTQHQTLNTCIQNSGLGSVCFSPGRFIPKRVPNLPEWVSSQLVNSLSATDRTQDLDKATDSVSDIEESILNTDGSVAAYEGSVSGNETISDERNSSCDERTKQCEQFHDDLVLPDDNASAGVDISSLASCVSPVSTVDVPDYNNLHDEIQRNIADYSHCYKCSPDVCMDIANGSCHNTHLDDKIQKSKIDLSVFDNAVQKSNVDNIVSDNNSPNNIKLDITVNSSCYSNPPGNTIRRDNKEDSPFYNSPSNHNIQRVVTRVYSGGSDALLPEQAITSENQAKSFLNGRVCQFVKTLSVITQLQNYAWRAVSGEGISCFIIGGKGSGKTMGYTVPLSSCLLDNLKHKRRKNSSSGIGPAMIVLCCSWKKVEQTAKQFSEILQADFLKIMAAWGGIGRDNEKSLMRELFTGCDILITTAPCLSRLVKSSGEIDCNNLTMSLSLAKCSFLVVDDADVICRTNLCAAAEILDNWIDCSQNCRSESKQLIITGSQWSDGIIALERKISSLFPTRILIAAHLEAAVAVEVQNVIHYAKPHQNTFHMAMNIIQKSLRESKTLIFVDTEYNGHYMKELLSSVAIPASVICYQDLKWQIEETTNKWHNSSLSVIIVCEESFNPLYQYQYNLRNASNILHIGIPESAHLLGRRYSFMLDHFPKELEKKCHAVSHFILSEQMVENNFYVIHEFERMGIIIPAELAEAAQNGLQKCLKKKEKMELCYFVKSFGKCGFISCWWRHEINENDIPNTLPSSGEVEFEVLFVLDASRFMIRLSSYSEPLQNVTVDLSFYYKLIFMKLQEYFDIREHRKPLESVEVGRLCAVQLETYWARAKIVEIDSDTVNILLIDEGFVLCRKGGNLYKLSEALQKMPQLCIEMYLCNVKPVDSDNEWTLTAINCIKNIISNDEDFGGKTLRENKRIAFRGKINLALGHTLWLGPVIPCIKIGSRVCQMKSLRSTLCSETFGEDNPSHMNDLKVLCEKSENLTIKNDFEWLHLYEAADKTLAKRNPSVGKSELIISKQLGSFLPDSESCLKKQSDQKSSEEEVKTPSCTASQMPQLQQDCKDSNPCDVAVRLSPKRLQTYNGVLKSNVAEEILQDLTNSTAEFLSMSTEHCRGELAIKREELNIKKLFDVKPNLLSFEENEVSDDIKKEFDCQRAIEKETLDENDILTKYFIDNSVSDAPTQTAGRSAELMDPLIQDHKTGPLPELENKSVLTIGPPLIDVNLDLDIKDSANETLKQATESTSKALQNYFPYEWTTLTEVANSYEPAVSHLLNPDLELFSAYDHLEDDKNTVTISDNESPNELQIVPNNLALGEEIMHIGEFVEVAVEEIVSPLYFYVTKTKNRDRLSQLDNDVEDAVTDLSNYEGRVGDICLAKFSNEGFYRAKILNVLPEGYSVFFIDYGEVLDISKSELYPCPTHLYQALPAQALRCQLADIAVPEHLVEKATQLMEKVVDSTATWMVEVMGVQFEDNKIQYVVDLIDTTRSELQSFSQILLSKKLAHTSSPMQNNTEKQSADIVEIEEEEEGALVDSVESAVGENRDASVSYSTAEHMLISENEMVRVDDASVTSEDAPVPSEDAPVTNEDAPVTNEDAAVAKEQEVECISGQEYLNGISALPEKVKTKTFSSVDEAIFSNIKAFESPGSKTFTKVTFSLMKDENEDLPVTRDDSKVLSPVTADSEVRPSMKTDGALLSNRCYDNKVLSSMKNDSEVHPPFKDGEILSPNKDNGEVLSPKNDYSEVLSLRVDNSEVLSPRKGDVGVSPSIKCEGGVSPSRKGDVVVSSPRKCEGGVSPPRKGERLTTLTIDPMESKIPALEEENKIKSLHPETHWKQDLDKVYLRFCIPDVVGYECRFSNKCIRFLTFIQDTWYRFDHTLFSEIDPESCLIQTYGHSTAIVLVKNTKAMWPRLLFEKGHFPWLRWELNGIAELEDTESDEEQPYCFSPPECPAKSKKAYCLPEGFIEDDLSDNSAISGSADEDYLNKMN